MGSDDKVQERRIRRALDRLGLKLVRSRAKDTPAPTTGSYLITSQAGAVLAGMGHSPPDDRQLLARDLRRLLGRIILALLLLSARLILL